MIFYILFFNLLLLVLTIRLTMQNQHSLFYIKSPAAAPSFSARVPVVEV